MSTRPRTIHAARPSPKPDADVKNIIDGAGCIILT
jgi:hypothetical protein